MMTINEPIVTEEYIVIGGWMASRGPIIIGR